MPSLHLHPCPSTMPLVPNMGLGGFKSQLTGLALRRVDGCLLGGEIRGGGHVLDLTCYGCSRCWCCGGGCWCCGYGSDPLHFFFSTS